MTQKLNHAIIIRLHYPPSDLLFTWRLAFFREFVLPRLLFQTNSDFEIWVICHPEHANLMTKIHPKIHVCPFPHFPKNSGFSKSNYNEMMPHFDIQTSLDSDDLVSQDYVEKIKQEVSLSLDKPLVLSFQPYKLALITMKKYRMWERYYEFGRCSMFYSLYLPKTEIYECIYNFDHSFITDYYKNIVHVPEGYCDMVIHGGNWMTDLKPHLEEVL